MPPPPPRKARGQTILEMGGVFIGLAIALGLIAYHAARIVAVSYGPIRTLDTVLILGIASFLLMDITGGLSLVMAWLIGLSTEPIAEGMRKATWTFAIVFVAVWTLLSSLVYGLL